MRAKIRDTEIYFDVEGAGLIVKGDHLCEKPAAFLVHGGPGADHTGFKPLFSRLSNRMQLVYFDHRGQGRSARGAKATYTLEHNVEDMEALRQHLGLAKIIVIGGSYGGMVALTYASRYPQHVSHLIVMVTVADSRFLAAAKQNLAERGTPEQQAIAQHLWDGSFRDEAHLREFFQLMRPLYSVTASPDDAPSKAGERAILSPDATNEAFGGFLRAYDIRDQLPNIKAPALIIAGRHDWICPPKFSEEIAALIPNSDLRIFEQSGHSIRADEPEALLDAIAGFIVYNH